VSCGGLVYTEEIDGRMRRERRVFDPQRLVAAGIEVERADVLRFKAQGPQAYLHPIPEERQLRETWDGVQMRFTHALYLTLADEIPPGTTRRGLKDRIASVLRDSNGWANTGIWIQFTDEPEKYGTKFCTVYVHPYGDLTCGDEWTSCAHVRYRRVGAEESWQIWVDLKLAHLVDERTRVTKHFGPNHEIFGHIALGACDMYKFENAPAFASTYGGVMDSGIDGSPVPTAHDKAEGLAKMRSQARYPMCGYPA